MDETPRPALASIPNVLLAEIRNNASLRDDGLWLVDRRRLPAVVEYICCPTVEDVARAIEAMVVQGGTDIAFVAGFGLLLSARELEGKGAGPPGLRRGLALAADRLKRTRPTGSHLRVLVDDLYGAAEAAGFQDPTAVMSARLEWALNENDQRVRRTGALAAQLLRGGDAVLTICYPGPALLYMLAACRDEGREVSVICAETRPYLQGARLTAHAVSQLGYTPTVITDGMVGHCMAGGLIQACAVGADRVACDGTVANKVGTLQAAIAARHFGVPFYVLAVSGPDPSTEVGTAIPVEHRDPQEVLTFRGTPIAPPAAQALYPAFDLTPPALISAIVTSSGIHSPFWLPGRENHWSTRSP